MKFIFYSLLAVSFLTFLGCEKEKGDDSSTTEEPAQTMQSGQQPQQPVQNAGQIDQIAEDEGSCDSLVNGQTENRTRFESSLVTLGLNVCSSEIQTGTCNDGTMSWTGSFTNESCEAQVASINAGDVLIGYEDADQILAFSNDGTFKGHAFSSVGLSPWYLYGMRLSYYRNSTSKYSLELGSGNSDLDIQLKKFTDISSYPFLMESYSSGPASDALYFQGAMSEDYNSIRYVATEDGKYLDVYYGDIHIPECRITMPAGKHARALYYGTQSFFYSPYVAYTLGTGVSVTGYGVKRLNGTCLDSQGTPPSLVDMFETAMADAKITGLLHVRTDDAGGAGSWKNDIFVTVGGFLYGQFVRHWHYDSVDAQWEEQADPFVNTAHAIVQDDTGDIYTLEVEDSTIDIVHLRRYGHLESMGSHLKSTIFSDEDQTILKDTSLGKWLIVMPEL
jgi:hypothetical protein